MSDSNSTKSTAVIFISLALFLLGGVGGFVLARNSDFFLTSQSSSVTTKGLGTKDSVLSQLTKKPVSNIFLSVMGKVKSVSSTAITIAAQNEEVTLKVDPTTKPYRLSLPSAAVSPMSGVLPTIAPPQELSWTEIKPGDQVNIMATFKESSMVVTSLMVTGT